MKLLLVPTLVLILIVSVFASEDSIRGNSVHGGDDKEEEEVRLNVGCSARVLVRNRKPPHTLVRACHASVPPQPLEVALGML